VIRRNYAFDVFSQQWTLDNAFGNRIAMIRFRIARSCFAATIVARCRLTARHFAEPITTCRSGKATERASSSAQPKHKSGYTIANQLLLDESIHRETPLKYKGINYIVASIPLRITIGTTVY